MNSERFAMCCRALGRIQEPYVIHLEL